MSQYSSELYLQYLRWQRGIVPQDFPAGFPFSEFQRNLMKYNEEDDWYKGTALDEEMGISGKSVKKYPVRINPIHGTVQKHVSMLFGDIRDDDQALVSPRVVNSPGASNEEKKHNKGIEEILQQIWYESNGRDIQLNAGFFSQRYGGCVFYAKYDPLSQKTYPITIEAPNPKYFIGVPNSSNPFYLEECWIIKPISPIEISNFGYVAVDGKNISDDNIHWMCEHYTRKIYDVSIDGKQIGINVTLPSGKKIFSQLSGENAIGIVPAVYIPHVRNTSNFYGDNAYDNVVGIVRELNARIADFGDSVSMESHETLITKNITGKINVSQLMPGVARVDLGSGMNVTGQEAQPDATPMKKNGMMSDPTTSLINILISQYRRDAFHPAICDGEDQGSQRSSQTLTIRMWPLQSHASTERQYWSGGLRVLSQIILATLVAKNIDKEKIKAEDINKRIRQVWYPNIAKDRQDLVTEVSTLVGSKVMSPETAIDSLGNVEDPEEEVSRIIDFWTKISEAEEKAKAKTAPKPQPGSTNGKQGLRTPAKTKETDDPNDSKTEIADSD